MLKISVREIADIVGGRIVGDMDATALIDGDVTIDSRAVRPGDVFAAYVGERVDGHNYAAAAVDSGAALCLLTRDVGVPGIVIEDMTHALSALARATLDRARQVNPRLKVAAVTGSAGKTGVKDLLGQILSSQGPTIAPPGSLNNEIGLPLTVLKLRENTAYLVLEMGARGIGHIAHLTSIARPDVAVVLNVGTAHLGEFGSADGTAQAKGELVEALAESGRAVLNADDPRVAGMATRAQAPVTTWGLGPANIRAEDVRLSRDACPCFRLVIEPGLRALGGEPIAAAEYRVSLQLVGEHQVYTALAAMTTALVLGVDADAVCTAVEQARAVSPHRMAVHHGADGVTIIDDAYNANPDSMRSALRTLAHLGRGQTNGSSAGTPRTIAVLGEMRELGPDSVRLHDEIGRLAVRYDINLLLTIGDGTRPMHQGALLEGSFGGEAQHVDTIAEAEAVLQTSVVPGDIVLVKSSLSAGLCHLADRLVAIHEPAAGGDGTTTRTSRLNVGKAQA
ncbi:UDP-N-acetylmuramoyl-tripeptide--D-alanyl-D-alanine ligase [Devriesea agamarum]|uniref:UDP-N-acetylmuramoyl-tripeptide--D-alanyl-D- alanine ligase n=1 Tax=Devriesea agamarum TaxID=472569 RepID=UPI00071DFE05|nr:UDP-N-acetylmuramoyl-tripeptide--D-alanyl-D-alanine ligase [Devriesea agamarum]